MTRQELIEYIEDGLNHHKGFFSGFSKYDKHKEYRDKLVELTSFLLGSTTNRERYYCLINHITSITSCLECDNPVKFDSMRLKKYQTYCSCKCASSSKVVKNKKKITCLIIHGVENVTQSEVIRDKKKATMIERHGVEHALQSDTIKAKTKATNLERYGVEYGLQSELVKAKSKATLMKNHGVENPTQSKEIYNKIKSTCLEKYGVENPFQSDTFKDKTKTTNLEKYGVVSYTQQHYSQDTLDKLNDRYWLMTKHHKEKLTLVEISRLLGLGDCTAARYFNKLHIKVNQVSVSAQERELQDFIKSMLPDIEILFNDREQIKPRELDIYIPSMNLAIEYNGLYWHSDKFRENDSHLKKLELCLSKGITLIQVFEDEWTYNQNLIKKKLQHLLNQDTTKSIYARKCVIKSISNEDYNNFLIDNHVQGTINASIRYGLYHDNTLVSVLSFKQLKDNVYDLVRFASSTNVTGGFSKLLSHFKRNNDYNEIYTFADRRWSTGQLYINNGFTHTTNTPPNYFYVSGDIRLSRQKFMKHKLHNVLSDYDSSLTEKQNMVNHGFIRIYDCGHMKFSMVS